jgi:thymidylate kinase
MIPIILEGCDAVGKSSIAEELARVTGFEIVKGSSFEISQLGVDGMYEYMMELLDRKNIIIDRFFWSNYVYGKKYNYPTMSDFQFIQLACKAQTKALTVYVTADRTTVQQRMNNRGDDMIKSDEVEDILKRYEEVISNPLTSQKMVLRFDNTYISNDCIASVISEVAKLDETKMFMKSEGLVKRTT